MKRFILAAFLISSSALAQTGTPGPLPAGKPAGVKHAEINEVPWLLGSIAISLALGLSVFHYGNSSTTPATTA